MCGGEAEGDKERAYRKIDANVLTCTFNESTMVSEPYSLIKCYLYTGFQTRYHTVLYLLILWA